MAELRPNPYTILCPCCGKIICTKCAQFDDKMNSLCGCEDCDRAARGYRRRQREHMATYDHRFLDYPKEPTNAETE